MRKNSKRPKKIGCMFFIIVVFVVIFVKLSIDFYVNFKSSNSIEALHYIDERNIEGLCSLISEATRYKDDFDYRLENMMDFFEGNITDETFDKYIDLCMTLGSSVERDIGKWTRRWIVFSDVETTAGRSYRITMLVCMNNKQKPEYIGIVDIIVRREDGIMYSLWDDEEYENASIFE